MKILHLYHDMMNLYGDYANLLVLQRCLKELGQSVEIHTLSMGEKKDISGYDLQVLTPEGVSVSTKDAYSGIRPHLPEVPLRDVLARPVDEWQGVLVNDFEETVFAKYPELDAIKRSLYECGAVYASMSGSGSALFALFKA